MEAYRIENAHFVEFFERFNIEKGVSERTYVNLWCADDESFDEITDAMYYEGAQYIRAYHNAKTDGHGNAWNGEKWVVPEHFYRSVNGRTQRVDPFTEEHPSTTKSGLNRTWIIEATVYEVQKDGSEIAVNYPLRNESKKGKETVYRIGDATFGTEMSSKIYLNKYPMREAVAISLIDWLAK